MKVEIKGYPDLEVILRHYDAMHFLISYAIKTKDNGGREALDLFDEFRTRVTDKKIILTISE
jgi:aminoglycoside phosphotransferase family enzyme